MDNREKMLFWLMIGILCSIGIFGCSWIPIPDPVPTPPPPDPPAPWVCPLDMPECGSVEQSCSTEEDPCWHNPTTNPEHCEQAPDCPEPPPPPPDDPNTPPDPDENGYICPTPQFFKAGVYWYTKNRVADATPKGCRPDWYPPGIDPNRYCIPAAGEGPDNSDTRGYCEEKWMGGPLPIWHLQVTSGDLERANGPEEWMFIVKGHGTGKLWWCFPNGKACSAKLDVSR